jgi:hypothetical protein
MIFIILTSSLTYDRTSASSDRLRLRRLRDNALPPNEWELHVTKYFMNLRDGTEELLDPEGVEYETLDALRKAVLATARDLMCGDMVAGVLDFRFRIDAEDEDGTIVYTLPFRHAVNIIPDAVGYD